jgi:hypothetical protein
VAVSTVGSIIYCGNDATVLIPYFESSTNWAKVASGKWSEGYWGNWKEAETDTRLGTFSYVNFNTVETKLLKFTILDGIGGWIFSHL